MSTKNIYVLHNVYILLDHIFANYFIKLIGNKLNLCVACFEITTFIVYMSKGTITPLKTNYVKVHWNYI